MVLLSPDGVQWTMYLPRGGRLNRVISDETGLIAVGDRRTIIKLACSPLLAHLSPARSTMTVGETLSLSLTLSQPAPSSLAADLFSWPDALSLPDSVIIPAGMSQVTFDATALSEAQEIEVTASLPAESGSAIAVARVNVDARRPPPPRHVGRRVTP